MKGAAMTSNWADVQFDAHGKLVDVTLEAPAGPPPDMTWTNIELWAMTADALVGQVVSVRDHRGTEHSLVIASDLFADDAGLWVRVVTWEQFMDWRRMPDDIRPTLPTKARAVAAKTVWVIHEVLPS